ncbi:type 1 periplasmic binding fold superfamily protein [Neptunitalea lumnitzerae]|uniref:Type 1 periplasmic binding fold superfamily protein n=1 Tax=Neptunitalea lumnitzerae TaxID=2965509 RepID=A0ABQ5MJY2_9FLAO|nr:type 1 periplasmic binding fold superfamily protein [Neptunitalea sp. Y10]GLB49705.1 hypothetical protein Y10_20730 [Neptunitalea sp. Y10]
MKIIKHSILALVATISFVSCSDDDTPQVINEEEVITTMNVTLTSGSQTVTLTSQDLDGDGPNAPEITVSGNLAANTTYTGNVELLNETESPAENVTEEVEEENADHQFFFISTGAIADTDYADVDANGDPVGIDFTLTTGDAGTATLQVILRHLPEKDAEGVSDGDITNANGETDFQAEFEITVE